MLVAITMRTTTIIKAMLLTSIALLLLITVIKLSKKANVLITIKATLPIKTLPLKILLRQVTLVVMLEITDIIAIIAVEIATQSTAHLVAAVAVPVMRMYRIDLRPLPMVFVCIGLILIGTLGKPTRTCSIWMVATMTRMTTMIAATMLLMLHAAAAAFMLYINRILTGKVATILAIPTLVHATVPSTAITTTVITTTISVIIITRATIAISSATTTTIT
mmetsp:Transcript_15061/g.26703  ORF Transcript_15061/g.26703 Transcript_15061/m.26703 type:complete len:220 (-) Transcript_15061:400-1059(-)